MGKNYNVLMSFMSGYREYPLPKRPGGYLPSVDLESHVYFIEKHASADLAHKLTHVLDLCYFGGILALTLGKTGMG